MSDRNLWLSGVMGLVVADALGVPVEFKSREEIKCDPVKDMRGYGTYNMPPGTWSDDSSMTLATLDSMIRCGEIDYKDIMDCFCRWEGMGEYTPFGNAFDIGCTCMEAIYDYVSRGDYETCGCADEWANGNGSLMRILPVCLYAYYKEKNHRISLDQAMELVHKVSSLTHTHARSKIACGIYYHMIKSILEHEGILQECLQNGIDEAILYYQEKPEYRDELDKYHSLFDLDEFGFLNEESIKSSGYVVDTLEAAVWSLITTNSYEEAVLKAVNLGKDTDTVGAVTGGIAGIYYGYGAVPQKWVMQIPRREWLEDMCCMMTGK